VEGEGNEDNEDNEECAEFAPFDVLSVAFLVVLDVLFDVLLVEPSIVLVVVSSGSTLRAWKTITLSLK
jgi:hypothetical protein